MRLFARLLTLLVPTLALTACAYMPATTAARLAQFDPLTADASGLVVQLRLPDGAGLVPGSEVLTLEATNGADGARSMASYVLARTDDATGTLGYRIADKDRAAFTRQQALIAGWEAALPRETTGSLSLAVTPCTIGAGPARRARLSASITVPGRTDPMPLLRGLPLSRLLPKGTSDLRPCP